QRPLRPWVIARQGQLEMMLGVTGAVAEPVLDHELNPRRRQQVQAGRGDEGVLGQQLTADFPRVRIEDPVWPFLISPPQGHVPSEAGTGHAHGRLAEIVAGSVRRPGRERLRPGIRHLGRNGGRQGRRVDQVLLPEDVPQADEDQQAEDPWQLVPADSPVGGLRGLIVYPPPESIPIALLGSGWLAHLRTFHGLKGAAGYCRCAWDRCQSTRGVAAVISRPGTPRNTP